MNDKLIQTVSPKYAMAVMLPPKPYVPSQFTLSLKLWHALLLIAICLFFTGFGVAETDGQAASPFTLLVKWMPLLLSGFIFNLVISFLAMALGTVVGMMLGLGQLSLMPAVRPTSWFVTQFFRNAPWLVLLFFAMYLLPFKLDLGFVVVPLPDWFKAIVGLSLPVMANVSEIVRGAVRSLPSGQWEAAESLGYTRQQTMWLVILPQCVKRMLPPWMNLYSILTMATVLASIVGVGEVMTLAGRALAAEGGRPDLLIPFYSFVLLLFYIYCYPIGRWTRYLERKFLVVT
ncbi:amino acid ABC transporter permease [Candidatus Persebacteraceae bacterium Df01]|jgi:polar amino acid transport system permease protein|uniref:Amino acid ABC transporter permease n=1 Tax=Candidatus Doriopsillibacter californiensis TaxID=2970740 RepID=A0ABT7QN16_9GAMM|nr:amino acid ABC transporter permease [Candidatus Persebacteraceae bacterium Df01]